MTNNKRFLQKVSSFCAITFFVIAAISAVFLVMNSDGASDVYKASVGAATFFFFMVGIVLHAIGATDIPDLKIRND